LASQQLEVLVAGGIVLYATTQEITRVHLSLFTSHHITIREQWWSVQRLAYTLDCGGIVPLPVAANDLPSPKCTNRLWNPPSVLFSGYRGFRGPGWHNRYSVSLRDGRSLHRSPLGGQIFRARPDRP